MPLARLVCPHCEQSVEVNVTSVTRSRECPACRRLIMLQFTTKASRMKHRARLTQMSGWEEEQGQGPGVKAPPPASARGAAVSGVPSSPATPAKRASAPVAVAVPPPPVPQEEAPVPAPPQVAAALEPPEPPVVPTARLLQGDPVRRMEHDPEVRSSARALWLGLGVVVSLVVVAVLGESLHWWEEVARGWKTLQTTYLKSGPQPPGTVSGGAVAEATTSEVAPSPAPVKASEWSQEQDDALQALKAFLSAKTLEERRPRIRDAETLAASLKEYYDRAGDGPVPFTKVELLEAQPQGTHSYLFAVHDSSGAKREALVLRPEPGSPYVVDWGSFVIYSAMEWGAFVKARPTTPVLFRLEVVPAEHYNYNFLDSRRLLCLKLSNPLNKSAPPLYGYCTRNSTVGRSLDYMTRKNFGEPTRVIVKLRFPPATESDSPDQLWIDEMIAEGWTARGY